MSKYTVLAAIPALIVAFGMPILAFAQAGACHEPCRMPGEYCDGGLVCTNGTCESADGSDCGTRGNPGIQPGNNLNELPGATVTRTNSDGIMLMEPIGATRTIRTAGNPGLGVFREYFNLIFPWLVGMGGGVALLNAVWGGIKIIQAGGGQEGVSEGKNKLLLSLAGLLILLFSAVILNTLNPVFFR